MNSLQNIEYALNCEKCQQLAKFTCDSCHNYFVCASHNTIHCQSPLKPLPTSLQLNPSSLKSQLITLHQDLSLQFQDFQKLFTEIQQSLTSFFNESLKTFTNTLNDLEISLGSFCENSLIYIRNKSFIQCLKTEDIRSVYWENPEKIVKRIQEIKAFLVDRKKIAAGFEELAGNCGEAWERLKDKVEDRGIEAFNDLVMELEDDFNKVSRKKVEINAGLMKNSEFFKGLPEVCPNIYWVKARVPVKSLNVLAEILPGYQKLTVLELDLSGQSSIYAVQQLKSFASLPNLSNLVLNSLSFDSVNSKLTRVEFPSLSACSLINNGSGNSGLSFFIQALMQSRNLRYLMISKNNLTHNNLKSLNDALELWDKLSYLRISENNLDDKVIGLVSKLKSMDKVVEFHFLMNQVAADVVNKVCLQAGWGRLNRLVIGFGIELACLKQIGIDMKKIFLQNNKLVMRASNFISN